MPILIIRCIPPVLCVLALSTLTMAGNLNTAGRSTAESGIITRSYDNEPAGEYCKKLHDVFQPDPVYILWQGKRPNLDVMWGARASVRVAAALMVAILRHVHGYGLVQLRQGPRRLCQLVSGSEQLPRGHDTIYMHMGAEWSGENEECEHKCASDDLCFLAGPQLKASEAATAPRARLYVRLSTNFSEDHVCSQYHTSSFYTDQNKLRHCGFFNLSSNVGGNCLQNASCIKVADVTALGDTSTVVTELERRAKAIGIRLHVVPMDRATLRHVLNNDSVSIIFIDYELWSENSVGVRALQPPPCIKDTACTDTLDNIIALKVSDLEFLRLYAPIIDHTIWNLKPNGTQLRQLLDLEAETNNSIEAACAWASNNLVQIKKWTNVKDIRVPAIVKLICRDDPDIDEYNKITQLVVSSTNSEKSFHKIQWFQNKIYCNDSNTIADFIGNISRVTNYQIVAGIVAMGGAGASSSEIGAAQARLSEMQLALFGVPSAGTRLAPATTAVTGRHNGLALAFRRLFALQGWKRIAIISEKSVLANDFSAALVAGKELIHREEKLDVIDYSNVQKALERLIAVDARVIVVNAGVRAAGLIACVAHSLQITDVIHLWIVREWNSANCVVAENMRVFSLSYAWRGRAGLSPHQNETKILGERRTKLRAALDKLWEDRAWPLHASAFTDALLAQVHALSTALKHNPSLLYSLHETGAASNISEWAARDDDLWGVAQRLRLGAEPRRATVFVEEWRPRPATVMAANTPPTQLWRARLLAAWTLPSDTTSLQNFTDVEPLTSIFDGRKAPHDGTPGCMTTLKGEPFTAHCLDVAWGAATAVLLLAPLALWAAARARRARLQRRERALHVRLLARCERTASALRPLLLPRAALTLCGEELGSGHFGRVSLGLLRLPNRPAVAVAAKALRSDAAPAEEAEFLREGCMLAALQHAHVVRLLGVCAADGPPLLLMEYAFFGDLLRYLHERRHLAELAAMAGYPDSYVALDDDREAAAPTDPEATHVSAVALTRLAKEAAEALAYLAKRRYVHRDVRAANCLVDTSRALKLADFGLARATTSERDTNEDESLDSTHADELYAYICRRRGVFPVPWMAPESLADGVFSAASDVWALGVLMLELVTLGARPYGAWRPPKVLRFVRDGGQPPLPRDASYSLCEVTAMCWERHPEQRARAEDVRRYLVEHPRALRPALRPSLLATTEANDEVEYVYYPTDSGFSGRDTDDWLPNKKPRASSPHPSETTQTRCPRDSEISLPSFIRDSNKTPL